MRARGVRGSTGGASGSARPARIAALLACAALGLAACADLGLAGRPPAAPPPAAGPDSARVDAAFADLVEAFRAACVTTPLDLEGAEERLAGLGFTPAPAADDAFPRYVRGDVRVELRRGDARPVQATNCLATSALLTPRAARAAATQALADAPAEYRLLGPEEARTLSPDGATVGLGEGPGYDALARVVDMVQDREIVAGLALIKTR